MIKNGTVDFQNDKIFSIVRRPLGVSEKISITSVQFEQLVAIERYDMWFVVEKLSKKAILSTDVIELAIQEFKKYVALIVLGHTNLAMLSSEVDLVWHNFILFTKEYAEFCQNTVGRFIHHRPATSRSTLSKDGKQRLIEAYLQTFGDPPSIWTFSYENSAPWECGSPPTDEGPDE